MTTLILNASSQNKSELNISLVTRWTEKLDIQYDIERYPNQSVTITVYKDPFLYMNLTSLLENNSTKNAIYDHLGIKHDFMSYGNTSYANVYITRYNTLKLKGKNEYWEASLELVRE